MFLRIEQIDLKQIIGNSIRTNFTNNKTAELWKLFLPHRSKVLHTINQHLISVQVNGSDFNIHHFNPHTVFEKWAGVEVNHFENVPENMETLIIPPGLYAVFLHKGLPSEGHKTFQYIYGTWLPESIYEYDYRPQFEILDERYSNTNPSSEEEIWIPIKIRI